MLGGLTDAVKHLRDDAPLTTAGSLEHEVDELLSCSSPRWDSWRE